ncbi:hypothetical protein AB1Y20_021226 [Prymnesium parvum]|uniref:Dynamin GTPase n=1 Tax=Prymnesium parvum TaxID=97485 RepID=A0AB34JKX7_PRYPA
MERLLPVFNKLQDALSVLGGDVSAPELPQIVVVGSQSCGKSSVLESLVGRDFLPRGSGIVTRRPLLLQLVHVAEADAEWGEFLHLPDKKFTDFGEIRQEIDAETERKLGKGGSKRVSAEPIRLRIFSPHVVDLSLVDLPGVTRVPIADQPADIEQQLRTMVMQYIRNPNAVILAVSPANADLATSDAMQLSRSVDPHGERTMGVITKLDLMDAGTDALQILRGQVIPLRRGYVGVVNRSQQDIMQNKTPEAARAAEKAFFDTHPKYRTISAQLGTSYLAKRLNELLLSHVAGCLPELQQKMQSALVAARAELDGYGYGVLEGSSNQGALLLQLITKFCSNYCEAIDGTSAQVTEATRDRGELWGGARINDIFRAEYFDSLQALDACHGLEDGDIAHAIRQATGPRSPLFVPEVAFEVLARRQIALLRPLTLQAVEKVMVELLRLVPACLPAQVTRYERLRVRMQVVAEEALSRREKQTLKMVNSLVDIELAYLNTSHPDFIGGSEAMRLIAQQLHASTEQKDYAVQQQAAFHQSRSYERAPAASSQLQTNPFNRDSSLHESSGAASDPLGVASQGSAGNFLQTFFSSGSVKKEGGQAAPAFSYLGDSAAARGPQTRGQLETDIIRSLLVSYYTIVRKNLQDAVPKAIMHFLVNSVRQDIQNELVAELYREHEFDEMLQEAEDTVKRRQDCQKLVVSLERATKVLDELRTMRSIAY